MSDSTQQVAPQQEAPQQVATEDRRMHQMLRTMPQIGRIRWIGLRPVRSGPVSVVSAAEITLDQGLVGDHFSGPPGAKRQVTLIQFEHLAVMAAMLGLTELDPAIMRRNIAVSGINLLALKNARFQIGDAVLEYTGPCAPCSMIEDSLGPGAYNISRGHAGITARVVQGGRVTIDSEVKFLGMTSDSTS